MTEVESLEQQIKKGTTRGAYFSLTVCKCAVCVPGPLLVCFCQWRCTFSSSYAKDGSGTDGQSPLMVSVAAFQPREKAQNDVFVGGNPAGRFVRYDTSEDNSC